MKSTEYILCAAIKITINDETIIISGYRHGDCFNIVHKLCLNKYINQDEQGFLTSSGSFVDRIEAKIIAKKKQISLFENLFLVN